jgi:nifR3 family TIM-barrel protein
MINFGFWKTLPRPFMVLAPMSGYTDAAFRGIIAKYGKPDVMYTEFVPAEGLCSSGRANLLPILWKTDAERPVVAQLYGGNPDDYEAAARDVASLGFDGIDINMGCPARAVERRLGGSALIKDPARAQQIIAAAKAGAGSLPVSVKTRIGYSSNEIESWLGCLLEMQPAAITLHARTRTDAYNIEARWDVVARAVELVRERFPEVQQRPLLIGNGDVRRLTEAYARAQDSGCDGVMVGRGMYGNPWFFNRQIDRRQLPLASIMEVMLEHTALYMKLHGNLMPIEPMRKHLKSYLSGVTGALELRDQLLRATSFVELQQIAQAVLAARNN